MKLWLHRLKAIILTIVLWAAIPIYVMGKELINAWKSLYVTKGIKREYSSLWKALRVSWEYDFDNKKIKEVQREEYLDKVLRR